MDAARRAVFVLVPLAYLLGTFPSASIVARRKGVDVTAAGSGNPGASNITRLLGWKAGLLVLLLDMGKGAAAAAVGLVVADGHVGAYILGVAAVLGHVFPITRQFKGGRGVATAAGVLVVLFPLLTLGVAVLWFVIVRLTQGVGRVGRRRDRVPDRGSRRRSSVGDVTVIAVVALIVVVRHASNLNRLFRGEELGLDPGGRDGAER